LSGLNVTASRLDLQKIQIIGFFFEKGYNGCLDREKNFYTRLF
jgi:hypothetical protein